MFGKKKIFVLLVGAVLGLLLAGCGAQEKPVPGSGQEEASDAAGEDIAAEAVSDAVYACLKDNWDSWNALDEEQRLLSSTMPGYCLRKFDEWADCEKFMGFSLFNPLEADPAMEKASFVGMSLQSAPHVNAEWYGAKEDQLEWIRIEGGYRSGDVRVMVWATVYFDPAVLETELLSLTGRDANSALPVAAKATESYYANEAYLPKGNVLYLIDVVGDPALQPQVQEIMKQVMESFGEKTLFYT